MASRNYVEGKLTLAQRLDAETRLARLDRRIAELSAQREQVLERLAADINARVQTGELTLRGRAP